MATRIEWADDVWNPTLGCSQVSPGCQACYAIGQAHRGLSPAHRGLTVRTSDGIDWTGEVRYLPERLDIPLRRRKPTRWFVDSMSDLFHPAVPGEFIAEVWARMEVTPRHTYQVLTKRPQHMAAVLADRGFHHEASYAAKDLLFGEIEHPGADPAQFFAAEERCDAGGPLYPNVWVGTSIETDAYCWRADHVRAIAGVAGMRWLSLEPLLGPLPSLNLDGIDWVVIGGESGPRARPMEIAWADAIVEQCRAAGVAPFVKQLGSALGGRTHHDIDTFPHSLRVREYPSGEVAA